MRKIIVSFKLKDILVGILIFNLCIIFLSLIVIGKNKEIGQIKEPNSNLNKKVANKEVKNKKENSKEENNIRKEVLKKYIDPKVKIYLTKEKRVIQLDLEDYIVGVVSAEMPANFGEEALKAQAVAARTYTVAHMKGVFGGGCNLNKDADLCDSVHCQAYINKEKRLAAWPKSESEDLYKKVEKAVKDTKCEVISYEEEIIMTPFYFATSSGKTENAEEVFATSSPYLKSVESPGEEIAPKFKKEFVFLKEDFIKALKGKYPNLNVNSNNLNHNISILERSEGGSVKKVKIGNIVTTGKVVRSVMGLTSANFNIEIEGNNIKFNCKGYGHGVGMSQWGASVMAKEGKDYKYILNHYYKDTKISKLKYK
ncbi:stage II sporulation protein D [Hathewaya massiliensis]|uniref:stage II sporulation protein D n=1 Tax=Hathewaya massiliensis TaxID=1964382 RepID=UPI0011587483|nr:stage II sporulation protein D [Hathewaya massiliensis]